MDKEIKTRVERLRNELRKVDIYTTYRISETYQPISNDFMKLVTLCGMDLRDAELKQHNTTIKFNDRTLQEHLICTVKAKLELPINTEELYRKLTDLYAPYLELSPPPPEIFHYKIVEYRIDYYSNPDTGALGHITKLICGIVAEREKRPIPNYIRTAYTNQLKQYLETGTIDIKRPDKIDPDNPDLRHMLCLSDECDGLDWKYSKYCLECGEKIIGCYCKPSHTGLPEKDEQLEYRCWNCATIYIKRHLTRKYTKKYTKEICRDIFNEYFDIDEPDEIPGLSIYNKYDADSNFIGYKKVPVDKIDEVFTEMTMIFDDYDNESDDQCSCPLWSE